MQTFYQFLEATPPPAPSGPKDPATGKGSSSPPSTSKGASSSLPSGFGGGMPPGLGGGPPIGLGGGGPPLGSPSLGGPMGGEQPGPAPNKVQKIQGVDVFKSLEKTLKSRQKEKDSL